MAVIPKAGEVFHGDDGTISIVLPDACDPNSEPTREELVDYASWLGFDAEKEPHLLWIARQGLRTPLPAEWKACRTGEGDVYYFNFLTGESSWEHPMDEVFKQKVEEERARLPGGDGDNGRSRKKGKASSSAGGGRGEDGVETRRLEKGAAGHVTSPERSVKGKKLGTVMTPSSLLSTSSMTRGLPTSALRFGRLGALGTPEATRRVTPDVSALLTPSSAGDRAFNRRGFGGSNTSTSSLGVPAGGIGGGVASGKLSLTKPPDGVKEMEAQICRRLDDEIDARRRVMRNRHEAQILEERAAMEAALQKVRDDGERAVAAAQQRRAEKLRQRAQAELESARRALEKECAGAKERVASLRQTLQRERVSMEKALQERLGEVREELQLSHTEGLKGRREASAARLKKERARLLEDFARRLDTEAQELEHNTQTTVEAFKNTLEAERAKLKGELTDKATRHGNDGAPSAAAEAEAQRAYEAAVQKATSDAASAMETLRCEYRAMEETLQAAKEEASRREKKALTVTTPSGNTNSNDGRGKREAEAEAKRLEMALRQKAAQYEAETQRLVAMKQAEVMASVRPLGGGAEGGDQGGGHKSSSGSSTKAGLSATKAAQEQRRFEVASRRLETKHAQSLDCIRREHERTLREKNLFNPRQSPGYMERLQEEHKSWLKAHPPAALTMPQLEPVPASGFMNASPVPMPSEEEQQKSIDAAVASARQKRAAEDEDKLTEMETMLSGEMKEAVAAYREGRLKELEVQLTHYRETQAKGHQQQTQRMAATIAEEAKTLAKRQSSASAVNKAAEAPPQSSQLGGKAEDPVLRMDEVILDEAKTREEGLRQYLQGRIELLGEMIRCARAQLRQRQHEAQGNTPALNLVPPTTAANMTVALQRPPPVPTDTLFSGMQDQQFSLRPPQQQQQQPRGTSTPVLNRTLSTIAPANSLWSSARPSPTKPYPWLTADNAASSLPWQETPAPVVGEGGVGKASPPSLPQRNLVLEDRLHRASFLLKERKEELRAQRAAMERVREIWRRDMGECRTKRDRDQALMLREVKVALEEKAAQLNREVMDVKRAAAWLSKRTARYKQTLNPPSAPLAPAEDMSMADHTSASGSGRIISLLEGILASTELLGSYMASTTKTDAKPLHHGRCRSSPSPQKRHTHHRPTRHKDTTQSWTNTTPSGVTRWLVEQRLSP